MITVGAYEAKTHLSELLDKVVGGERVTITRHGVPVATLVPAGSGKMSVDDAVDRLAEFGRGKSLGGLTVREMIEEGRRY
jgi:prevent-host-death family protein